MKEATRMRPEKQRPKSRREWCSLPNTTAEERTEREKPRERTRDKKEEKRVAKLKLSPRKKP
jgi:hypothetical protein